jgi:hypothetical protein
MGRMGPHGDKPTGPLTTDHLRATEPEVIASVSKLVIYSKANKPPRSKLLCVHPVHALVV